VAIKLTEKAAAELKTIMTQEIEQKSIAPDAVVRLAVVGGGCSGFSYKMGFDEVKPGDRIEELNGLKVAVDQKSYLYLNGTEVDFQDGLMGRGFVFQNPNSSGSCGCGQSFSA
jgi:iron-sulfur cluster assembly protein